MRSAERSRTPSPQYEIMIIFFWNIRIKSLFNSFSHLLFRTRRSSYRGSNSRLQQAAVRYQHVWNETLRHRFLEQLWCFLSILEVQGGSLQTRAPLFRVPPGGSYPTLLEPVATKLHVPYTPDSKVDKDSNDSVGARSDIDWAIVDDKDLLETAGAYSRRSSFPPDLENDDISRRLLLNESDFLALLKAFPIRSFIDCLFIEACAAASVKSQLIIGISNAFASIKLLLSLFISAIHNVVEYPQVSPPSCLFYFILVNFNEKVDQF
jgi:hypothetical protein